MIFETGHAGVVLAGSGKRRINLGWHQNEAEDRPCGLLGEMWIHNPKVSGSSPLAATNFNQHREELRRVNRSFL